MATQSVRIPGIEDLLVSPYQSGNPLLMAKAAANARGAIGPGIAAIGELMWRVADSKDWDFDKSIAFDIGVLLKMLSELNESLTVREINGYQLHHKEQQA